MQIPDSNRLSFRLMDDSDANILFELDQDPEVMKYLTKGKLPTRNDIDAIFVPRMLAYRNPQRAWGMWHVSDKASGQFLGWVLIRPMYFFSGQPNETNLELGWRFKRSVWGKGIATEAAQHIAQYVTQHNAEVHQVSAIAVPENLASIKVMQKLGMT